MVGFDLALTVGVIAFVLIALIADVLSADAIFVGALVIVVLGGVIDLDTALQGFGNSTLLALGSLYVVAAALRTTGALDAASQYVLGRGKNVRRLLLRMCPPVTIYSAFLNNTPVVAMGIPAIRGWCRRHGVSPSRLLMPLSFAAILGGICTLIGTSTNLVVHGLLQSHDMPGLGFFELAWVGVPCAVLGLGYVIFLMPSLLKDRADIREEEEAERADLVEVELAVGSPLVDQTVEEAELDLLPDLALARIQRGDRDIAPVATGETLQPGDRLLYTPTDAKGNSNDESNDEDGAAKEAASAGGTPDLSAFPGLRLAYTDVKRTEDRELHQVVVREGSALIGERVREVPFKERFGAAVTGIRRGGERLEEPLNEIKLRPGDTLLLDTQRGFREAHEENEAFMVASEAGGEKPGQDHPMERAGGWQLQLSVAVIVGIVALVGTGLMHIAIAGPLGAMILVGAGIINPGEARRAVDWEVLIVIGAALGLGQAMEASGAAALMGRGIVESMQVFGGYGLLAGIVFATAVLTNVVTNNGAVALMFPVVLSVAESQGYDPRAMMIGMTLAGSMAFITPIGYQTNLMVYGPGNYRFADFTVAGGALQVVLWALIIILAPLVWPL